MHETTWEIILCQMTGLPKNAIKHIIARICKAKASPLPNTIHMYE